MYTLCVLLEIGQTQKYEIMKLQTLKTNRGAANRKLKVGFIK